MFYRNQLSPKPFIDDFFDIDDHFGVKHANNLSRQQIDELYLEKRGQHGFDQKTFFCWKVLRDPFYKTLVPNLKNFSELYEAGFFVDRLDIDDVHELEFKPGECRTPIYQTSKNLNNLAEIKKPIVLLCTGAFSPIHNGHIGMMFKARETLEKQGYQVVGGYFSPSHDAYVSVKKGGDASFPAAHRVYLCQMATADSDWLFVDPWESRYLPVDVNFTDVIERLGNYLNFYLKPETPIEVAYVFGGDNKSFTKAFKHKGIAVCVSRNQNETEQPEEENLLVPNVFFETSNDLLSEISSSAVRRWQIGLIPEEITRQYFEWRLNFLKDTEYYHPIKKTYVVRDDRAWALKPWLSIVSIDSLNNASDIFYKHFTQLLKNSFYNVSLPDKPKDIEVISYNLETQLEYIEQLSNKEHLLNLDICTNENSEGAIQISRLFALCNGQIRPEKLVPRPGFMEIEKQLARLESGEYTLIDDDIASGSTISLLFGLLPERIHVNKIRTLSEYSHLLHLKTNLSENDTDAMDIVDLRDFIFGAKAGGLVIELPNKKIARAPYSLPYISLVTRAQIPPSTELSFSKEIWKLNYNFFSSLDKDITIADTDSDFGEFCAYLKFPKTMTMKDFCLWHIQYLLKNV